MNIRSIQPGSTRADLLKLFEPAGGLSTRSGGIFVYKESRYISVKVQFDVSGNGKQEDEFHYPLQDKIIKISKPILDVPTTD